MGTNPMTDAKEELLSDGFRLVYQGGHHDVYCDSKTHIWTDGGYAGKWPFRKRKEGECDCAMWQEMLFNKEA